VRSAAIVTAVLALAGLEVRADSGTALSVPDPFARHSIPVADHVWLIYRSPTSTEPPFEGNVVVFEQSDNLVVVDAGGCPRSGENVVAEIRAISHKPVRFLVFTHYHGDHTLGAGAFQRAWPAVVIVSTAPTRASMTGSPMAYIERFDADNDEMVKHARKRLETPDLSPSLHNGWQHVADVGDAMVAGYKNLHAYPANLTFEESLALPDTETPLEVRFLGKANTDGDAVVWAPRQRVVATGDVVVNPVPYASASFPAQWTRVLAALKDLKYEALIPGHGPVLHDSRYIDALSEALIEIRSRVSKLAGEGKTLVEVKEQLKFEDLTDRFGGTDDWDRARFGDFFLGSIVSNAYKEAKGEPIVQGQDGG
jgi:glyoxylase-like metal-dependent hydrolase (beta-lactamase superfamily II)